MSEQARFWERVEVDKPDGCWLWMAGRTSAGYGAFWTEGRQRSAHVIAYEWLVGPVPNGLQLDHLCRVRRCVRPSHLEPVTIRENLLRGDTVTARNAAKTACSAGHAYSPDNVLRYKAGVRICRACTQLQRASRHAKRSALVARIGLTWASWRSLPLADRQRIVAGITN